MRLLLAMLLLCACARRDGSGREGGDVARSERERAVGHVDDLPPQMRRAFAPDGFTALGPPSPGDWLAEHPESGQTFDAFVASRPNRPRDTRRTIYIVALGDGGSLSTLLPTTVDYAERFFGLPTRELPALTVEEVGATERANPHTGQRQLLTTDILDHLRGRLPEDAYCLVALTEIDLYPEPSWNFVFGQASLRDRVGVWSIARYDDEDDRVVARRALKVMAHEVGHMFGMHHCTYYECLMNGTNHLAESDSRPQHLCPVCLRKLQWSTGFDPDARYGTLEDFYRREGLDDAADFAAARRR